MVLAILEIVKLTISRMARSIEILHFEIRHSNRDLSLMSAGIGCIS